MRTTKKLIKYGTKIILAADLWMLLPIQLRENISHNRCHLAKKKMRNALKVERLYNFPSQLKKSKLGQIFGHFYRAETEKKKKKNERSTKHSTFFLH